MKNKVWPVCPPNDKIWSQTDKLQRCRRLPLEQAELKQILKNNSEGVLIRKWFDRWYVAESLCDRLRSLRAGPLKRESLLAGYRLHGKIENVLISQQHESRRGRPVFSVWNVATIFSISTKDGSIRCLALTHSMIEEIQAHLLLPRVLTRCKNPFSSAETAQCPIIPNFFAPYIFVSWEHFEIPRVAVCGWKQRVNLRRFCRKLRDAHSMVWCFVHIFCSQVRL